MSSTKGSHSLKMICFCFIFFSCVSYIRLNKKCVYVHEIVPVSCFEIQWHLLYSHQVLILTLDCSFRRKCGAWDRFIERRFVAWFIIVWRMSTLQQAGDKMCLNWLENIVLIQNEHLMCSDRNSQSCGSAFMSIICHFKHGNVIK